MRIDCFGNRLHGMGVSNAFDMNVRSLSAFSDARMFDVSSKTGDPKAEVNYIHCLPAQIRSLTLAYGENVLKQRRNIAFWVCESTDLRPSFVLRSNLFDEIWTASEFCAEVFQEKLKIPVKILPHYVDRFSLRKKPDGRFNFLAVFDGGSRVLRKNPFETVQTFKNAFGKRRDTHLTIKTKNLSQALLKKLQEDAKAPNITVISKHFSEEELANLYHNTHCLISLHRAEGFGLSLLEAMGHGIPCVATGFSGNLTFQSEEDTLLVSYTLADCEDDYYHGQWARPDLDHAVDLLKHIRFTDVWDDLRTKSFERALEFSHPENLKILRQIL